MAKSKKPGYLKKAAKFATGQSRRKVSEADGSRQQPDQKDDDQGPQCCSSESEQQHYTASSSAVVGLSNLGNTCFFNSSVQLLLACSPLQQMLLQPDHHISKGPLGFALQQAAKFASGGSSSGGRSNSSNVVVYNPQSLLSAVCCHAPGFKGKQQHDSHELMRMMLDGLQLQEQRYLRELIKRNSSSSSRADEEQQQEQQQQEQEPVQMNGAVNTTGSSNNSSSSSESEAGDAASVQAASDSSSSSSSSSVVVHTQQPHGNSFAALDYGGQSDMSQEPSISGSLQTENGSDAGALPAAQDWQQQQQQANTDNEEAEACDAQHVTAYKHSAVQGAEAAAAADGCSSCGAKLLQDMQQQQQPGSDSLLPVKHQHHHHQVLSRKSLLLPVPPVSAGDTSVDAVFGGVLVSTITCTTCGHVSVSYEPFLDLSLSIPIPAAAELTRKGSLLSRFSRRSSGGGGKKKGGKAAGGDDNAAAAAGEAAGQQDQAAAAQAGKKLSKKERRKLQQEQKKAAIQAKKLARQAAKQQQSDQEDQQQQQQVVQQGAQNGNVSNHGSGSSSSGSSHQDTAADQSQHSEVSQQQQQQQYSPAGASPGSVSCAAAGRSVSESDNDSSVSGRTDPVPVVLPASPPTGTVGCWGAGWDSISPRPPLPAAAAASGGSSGANAHKPTHRRFSSLGSLSAFTSTARGGLTSLFSWQGRASKDGSAVDGAAANGGSGIVTDRSYGTNMGDVTGAFSPVPARPASALGLVSLGRDNAGLDTPTSSGKAAAAAALPAAAAATSAAEQDGNGRVGDSASNNADHSSSSSAGAAAAAGSSEVQTGSSGGITCAPGRCLGPTIPEDCPVSMSSSMVLTDTQRHMLKQQQSKAAAAAAAAAAEAAAAAAAEGSKSKKEDVLPALQVDTNAGGQDDCNVEAVSKAVESPFTQQAAYFAMAAASDWSQQQQRPALQRANSDDAFVRHRSSSTGGSDWRGSKVGIDSSDAGGSSKSSNGSQLAAVPPATATNHAAAATNESMVSRSSTPPPPAAAAAAIDTEDSVDKGPFAAAAAQTAAAAQAAAAADPFAPASVAESKDKVALSHCLASFFMREEISWECPKEKALWKEKKAAAAAAAAAGGGGGESAAAAAAAANGGAPTTKAVSSATDANDQVMGNGLGYESQVATGVGAALGDEASPTAAAAGVGGSSIPYLNVDVCDDDDQDGPIYKQVSFSDRVPEVIMVPGSVEQRGTDVTAAVAGIKPFYRPVTCSGAALLLTSQLKQLSELVSTSGPMRQAAAAAAAANGTGSSSANGDSLQQQQQQEGPVEGVVCDHVALGDDNDDGDDSGSECVIVHRVLVLGLRAAGEGGAMSAAAAARLLPEGKPVQLGQVSLPELEGISSDAQSSIIQILSQLVLNCMADLILHEGGVTGLRDMLAGGLSFRYKRRYNTSEEGGVVAFRDQYAAAAALSDEAAWKIRGQLPAGKTAAAAEGAAVAAAAAENGVANGSSSSSSSSSNAGGYWEYPAGPEAELRNCCQQQRQQQHGVNSSSIDKGPQGQEQQQLQPPTLHQLSPSQQLLQRQRIEQQRQQQAKQRRSSVDDQMFIMDEDQDQDQQQQCEQHEQSFLAQPVQAWEADDEVNGDGAVRPSAAAAAAAERNNGFNGYHDGQQQQPHADVLNGLDFATTEQTASASLFKKVPYQLNSGTAAAAAAVDTLCEQQQMLETETLDTGDNTNGITDGNIPRSQPRDIQSPSSANAAAAAAGSSPGDGSSAFPPRISLGASPGVSGTPGSLKSSLRRRSATFNRSAHKAYRLHIAPRVLMLHLKRFHHDGKGKLNKLDTPVKFEFELDMAPFMATAPAAAAAAAGEDCGSSNGNSSSSLMYDLVGVVVHMGTMRGGHYVAYVKRQQQQQQQLADASSSSTTDVSSDASNKSGTTAAAANGTATGTSSIGSSMFSSLVGGGRAAAAAAAAAAGKSQWYYVSDSSVKAVNQSEVAAAQAYMLMYVKRESAATAAAAAAAATTPIAAASQAASAAAAGGGD